MPKITTFDTFIEGKYTQFEVYYSSRQGGFYIKNCPNKIAEYMEMTHYETERDILIAFKQAVDKFHEDLKVSTKIILYSISLPTGIHMNKIDSGHYSGSHERVPQKLTRLIGTIRGDDSDCESYGFVINHRIVTKIEAEKTTYKELENGIRDGSLTRKYKIEQEIEWTQEREDFFNSLKESTISIIEKILQFLGKEDSELLKIFNTGSIKGNLLN